MQPGALIVKRQAGRVFLAVLCALLLWGCAAPLSADWISVSYPLEEGKQTVLLVERKGGAHLVEEEYIDGTQHKSEGALRSGAIQIDWLFQQLIGRELHGEWAEDARPVGVVRIGFNNHTSGSYHIYDTAFLEELFATARASLVDARQ